MYFRGKACSKKFNNTLLERVDSTVYPARFMKLDLVKKFS